MTFSFTFDFNHFHFFSHNNDAKTEPGLFIGTLFILLILSINGIESGPSNNVYENGLHNFHMAHRDSLKILLQIFVVFIDSPCVLDVPQQDVSGKPRL